MNAVMQPFGKGLSLRTPMMLGAEFGLARCWKTREHMVTRLWKWIRSGGKDLKF